MIWENKVPLWWCCAPSLHSMSSSSSSTSSYIPFRLVLFFLRCCYICCKNIYASYTVDDIYIYIYMLGHWSTMFANRILLELHLNQTLNLTENRQLEWWEVECLRMVRVKSSHPHASSSLSLTSHSTRHLFWKWIHSLYDAKCEWKWIRFLSSGTDIARKV